MKRSSHYRIYVKLIESKTEKKNHLHGYLYNSKFRDRFSRIKCILNKFSHISVIRLFPRLKIWRLTWLTPRLVYHCWSKFHLMKSWAIKKGRAYFILMPSTCPSMWSILFCWLMETMCDLKNIDLLYSNQFQKKKNLHLVYYHYDNVISFPTALSWWTLSSK